MIKLGHILKEVFGEKDSSIESFFESHPELSSIGSLEQYQNYLKTIYPSSKVRDILYHGTNSKSIDRFRVGSGTYGTGVYLQTNSGKYSSGTFGSNTLLCLVDVQKPYTFYSDFEGTNGKLPQLWKDLRDKHQKSNTLEDLADDFGSEIRKAGYDALKIQITDSSIGSKDEFYYLIFDLEKIHILGSKEDVEGFKNFTKLKRND